MTIEELNKLIKEELDAYLGEDEDDGDEDKADEDMKEGKDDEKDEDMKEGKDDEKDEDMKKENMDHPNYRADYIKDVAHNAEKIKGGLNESFDAADRFKKLANIKG
jgi:hypothetical protein